MIHDDRHDTIAEELWSYCKGLGIELHENIGPRRVPGRGLGIYATGQVLKGERIVHVPTTALFTTDSISKQFASASARKSVPIHALLAAYFAFGPKDALDSAQQWLRTWPQYDDFALGTPLTWPERCRASQDGQEEPCFGALPPPLTGAYHGSSIDLVSTKNGSTTLVSSQAKKLTSHIQSLKPVLDPETYSELQNPGTVAYYKFLHAWLCVNTRCFSYTPHGKRRPTDPNEAMALCPGMDLFNHASQPSVKVKYDKTGYFATATRNHQPGDEILFNYGQHVNDVLWTEYGFLLDDNPDDAIRIDSIVLAGLDDEHTEILENSGYLNEYWLSASGVCYRTEVVAWLHVLSKSNWSAMLEGTYDPELDERTADEGENSGKKRTSDGRSKKQARKGEANSRSHRTICASWAAKVQSEAAASLHGLVKMSDDAIVKHFGDDDGSLNAQGRAFGEFQTNDADLARARRRAQATQRHAMCVKRWTQLRDMAGAAKSSIVAG